jgi:hypothetical protein
MLEMGTSGSEGGVALTRHPYPYRLNRGRSRRRMSQVEIAPAEIAGTERRFPTGFGLPTIPWKWRTPEELRSAPERRLKGSNSQRE